MSAGTVRGYGTEKNIWICNGEEYDIKWKCVNFTANQKMS